VVQEFPALVISGFTRDVQPGNILYGLFETLFPEIPVLITANDDKAGCSTKRHQNDRFTFSQKFTRLCKIDRILIVLG
jgi:hypothetical protein